MQNHLTILLIGILGLLCGLIISVSEEKEDRLLTRIAALEARQALPQITVKGPTNIWTEDDVITVIRNP